MQHSQYLRIESLAGGVSCSNREFIRVARSKLSPAGKRRANRGFRHNWLRHGLIQLRSARNLYLGIAAGRAAV